MDNYLFDLFVAPPVPPEGSPQGWFKHRTKKFKNTNVEINLDPRFGPPGFPRK